jgi:hypothetical protein
MIYLMGSPKPFLLSQITFGFIKSNQEVLVKQMLSYTECHSQLGRIRSD